MDKTGAVFEMIGMLTTAYFLGYLVEWFIGAPLRRLTLRLSRLRMTIEMMNIEMDVRNGKMPFPWFK